MRLGMLVMILSLTAGAGASAETLSERFAGPVLPADQKLYDEDKLKPAALKECAQLDLDLQRLEAELAKLTKDLALKRAEIAKAGEELERQWAQVDHARAAEAEVFRARQVAHRDMVDSFNAGLLARYNDRQALLQDRRGRFASLCAGKSFYTDDLEETKQALGIEPARALPQKSEP